MSVWDKQQNWIKDILSKKKEITASTTNNCNSDDKTDLRKMVYYTALPLIMKSETGGPSQLCLNQNQIMMNENGSFNGSSPSSQQAQLINLQNGDISGSSPTHQQNNYTYQLLTSVDHQQLQNQQLHHQQQQPQQQQQQQQQNVPQLQSVHIGRTPKQAKSFKCDQCNMNFGSKSAHTSHMKSHAKQLQQQQQQQSPPSTSLASSNSPVNSGSSNTTQMQSSDPYQCDVCKKTFAVPARLVRHYRTHTGERPFECEFCHKMFSVKENLQVHRRIHTKERPYKCDVCGRAFEHSGKLHRHMRIHTGERPHKCNVCGKTFIQSGQLVIHMRTHTGEKPYKCPVEGCGKGFTCSKQLKVHSRTHTGEKPYHCDICFRDFGYNHVLKLHRVQHYGSKCYKCTICDETFKNKKEMEAHIKGHANEMPDDDNMDDNISVNQSPKHQQQIESKNNILLTPSSSSSSLSSSPNTSLSHPIITKYELNDNTLINFGSPDQNMTTPITSVATIYPDTPKDSEASSEQNSDGDDMTYLNMYSRFEQSVVNSYGVNSGVNSALLAAASITAAAAAQPITITAPSTINNTNSSTLITLSPIQQNQTNQQINGIYDSTQLGLMRQNNYFGTNPMTQVSDFKSSNLVRCVEAALDMTPPRSSPRSSPESPDRSSSPESDSVGLADRDNNTLPPRKRKLYFKDNQSTDQNPGSPMAANKSPSQGFPRMSSVIHFAKAS